MIDEIMKQYETDRFSLLMKFKVDEEKYITNYDGEILNCISFLLQDGDKYYILEKGTIESEMWNAPYEVETDKLEGFDYRFYPRKNTTDLLIAEYKKQCKKMGFKVYEEFLNKMPSRLRPFSDEKPFYFEVNTECEDIDGNKQKSTFIKVEFSYNLYRNSKEHHYCYEYATGGGSLHISNGNMYELIKQSLRCHNIEYKEKKQEVYTQMSLFDFV